MSFLIEKGSPGKMKSFVCGYDCDVQSSGQQTLVAARMSRHLKALAHIKAN